MMVRKPAFSLRVAVLTLCFTCLMAGCVQIVREPPDPTPPQPPQNLGEADGRRYSLYLNQRQTLVMDSNGNELPPEEEFYILYDICTGLPQFKTRERIEDTGVRDEWGSPVVRHLQALYDLEENLLAGWDEVRYRPGTGDLVIRQDYRPVMWEYTDPPEGYKSVLWNYKTGETVWEGVDRVEALGEDALLLVAPDLLALGIIDLAGNPIAGFPISENWYNPYTHGEYIIASILNPYRDGDRELQADVLLTRDFEELYRFEYIGSGYFGAVGKRYLTCWQGNAFGVLTVEDGILYTVQDNARIAYFDGELLLLWRDKLESERTTTVYSLEKLDGTVIVDGYSHLNACILYSSASPAQRFVGIKDGTVQLIDREGQVLATGSVQGAKSIHPYGEECYECYFQIPGGENWNTSPVVLGPDLQVIIPTGTYHSFTRASEWLNKEMVYYDLIFAHGQNTQGVSLIDVYDLTGNLLIENLSATGTVGPNRIAVRKGYSIGMMDWQGNWIAQRSVFTDLADD